VNELDKYGDEAQRRVFTKAMGRLGKDVVRTRLASRQPIGDHPDEDPPPLCWILALIALASAAAGFVAAVPKLRSWSWFT
jgi:hypothetical protein